MNKKSTGIILMVGAILYFIFTSFIVGHGIHPLNTLIAIFLLVFGAITMFKREPEIAAIPALSTAEKTADENSALPMTQKLKIFFVSLAFGLLTAIIIALTYLATSAGETLTTILSFAGGVSNIVLPCTLPLVFIIVPLSMGKGYKKGLIMALLFGAGLTTTITAYGLVVATLGKSASLDQVSTIMFLIAGVAAFVFGLSQLRLVALKLPTYSGTPKFIQNRGDYSKSFFMGTLLGNAGVGCPNPLFYWLLIYIASTGSLEIGASLGAVHGIGRAVPLILLSI